MTLQEIERVLQELRFPLYIFHAHEADDRLWLQATVYTECPDTREVTRQHTPRWHVSREASASEVVNTALLCVLISVEHEARARFTYRGRALFAATPARGATRADTAIGAVGAAHNGVPRSGVKALQLQLGKDTR